MIRDKKEYHKQWYILNKERILKQQKEYQEKNRNHVRERNRIYGIEHRQERYEYQRKWREKRRLNNLAKKPKRKYLGDYEHDDYKDRFGGLREKVIQRDGEKCVDCGMSRQRHIRFYGVDITVDHDNGVGRNAEKPDNRMENLKTRCLRCHGKKDCKNNYKKQIWLH